MNLIKLCLTLGQCFVWWTVCWKVDQGGWVKLIFQFRSLFEPCVVKDEVFKRMYFWTGV